MAYVYRHIRLDKNEPFYIGISNGSNYWRATNRCKRNNIWKRIVSKTEYEVEILFDGISYEFAKEKEKEFIKLYGRINLGTGCLANMTDGGDGTLGMPCPSKGKKFNEEQRNRIRLSKLGEKNPNYGRIFNEEYRKKLSIANSLGNHNLAKKVICTKTNKTWDCIKLAALELGYKHSTLRAYLNGGRKNKTTLRYA
jgi:NUMOD3 motif